ncbi:hypothetical protein [Citreicoccus inhibens]|uniref:hypothetical protein n=1 Tax=Citreicoccus inhibens TaxID=2849499 RepID=UPI0013150C17|nr:hypothetical protein [Citreicoccus inhibens]
MLGRLRQFACCRWTVTTVAQVSHLPLEVVLATGARLRFPVGADVNYVAGLVTTLGG